MSKKMNPAIKRKWLAALRSGEYMQGRRKLRHAGRFCCLGVLCNLHAQAHPEIAAKEVLASMYLGESDLLPDEVRAWAGLDDRYGNLDVGNDSLIDLNDGSGCRQHSFSEIADVIEAHL